MRVLLRDCLLQPEFNAEQFMFRTVSIICSENYRITTKVQNTCRGSFYATLIESPVRQVSTMI